MTVKNHGIAKVVNDSESTNLKFETIDQIFIEYDVEPDILKVDTDRFDFRE